MNEYSCEELSYVLSRYADTIYRTAYIQMKSRDLADDIYQEVCMRLLKQQDKLLDEEHLKAWLIRTTVCCCKDDSRCPVLAAALSPSLRRKNPNAAG